MDDRKKDSGRKNIDDVIGVLTEVMTEEAVRSFRKEMENPESRRRIVAKARATLGPEHGSEVVSAMMAGVFLAGSDDDDLKRLVTDMTGLMSLARAAVETEAERMDAERPEDEYRIVGRWHGA